MGDQILPKTVPDETAEEWLANEPGYNPLEAAAKQLALKEQGQAATRQALAFGTFALGLLSAAYLVMTGWALITWIAAGLSLLLVAVKSIVAVRLKLQAQMALHEASVLQRTACGAIRIVRSPDDPTPVKLDPSGKVVEA